MIFLPDIFVIIRNRDFILCILLFYWLYAKMYQELYGTLSAYDRNQVEFLNHNS